MKKWLKAIFAALILGVMLIPAEEAQALTVQEIVVMSGQGLSDDVLVSIISGAETVPELTADERAKLVASGVSERVIRAIDERSANKKVEALPAKAEEKTPADDSILQTRAVGDETVLAPIESSNVPIIYRKFFEEAAETYGVQSEVARQYSKLQNETDAIRAHDADFPKVLTWIKEIKESPVRALESCLSLMEQRKPPLNTPLAVALNQCIGFSLEALEAPALGAYYLDTALQSEAKVYELPRTLKSFLSMAHVWGYSSQNPTKIKNYAREIKDGQRAEFLYLTAYSLIYGPQPDAKQASQILQNIEAGTIYYPRARILLATLAVRAPDYRFKTAAEYLNDAINSLSVMESSEAFELRNMAWLTLGRIAFENHAYEQADAFYRQVDVHSHHFKDSLMENAWGQLFGGKYAEALSLTHALRAPLFSKTWKPDLLIVEAGAYLGLCRYEMARRALDEFRRTMLAQSSVVQRYIAQTPSRDFYNQVVRHSENPDKSPIPEVIYHRILSDFSFQMLHKSLRRLTDERQQLGRYAGASFTMWSSLASVYDNQIAQYQEMLNVRLAGIYDEVLSELHALDISASQMAIEVRLAERRREAACLKVVASGGQCATPETSQDVRTISKGASDAYWSFEGEFWSDELMHYVSGLTSLCVE